MRWSRPWSACVWPRGSSQLPSLARPRAGAYVQATPERPRVRSANVIRKGLAFRAGPFLREMSFAGDGWAERSTSFSGGPGP